MAAPAVPEAALRHGNARPMPAVIMGTAESPPTGPERTRSAMLAAVEVGFRHFDTAALYGSEAPLGEAIAEAARRGLVASREEVFATSKLWCTQCHRDLVLPSLRESLRLKPGPVVFPLNKEGVVQFDFEGVWRAMEECHRLGLTKVISVSNFTTKHLDKLLAVTIILPAVNQNWGGHGNAMVESPVLAEIAEARGKTIAQVVRADAVLPRFLP
ncbi:hypothetical protein E2562_002697 [Oryza meyeriana var. granulata]|uniref:NADP-dependent oxidoreductase domain-containing protein n=1 Tax=Oryza meyeriana var. granulata TaxID=110450 RepID=A0A6G1BPJ5_9ORYZ|nr:hypothetical protein E2562_002697 [Oryza meyeriana var. granulata]